MNFKCSTNLLNTNNTILKEEYFFALKKPFNEKFLALLLTQYRMTKDFCYYYLYANYFLLDKLKKGQLDNEPLVQEISTHLQDYLNKIDIWGHFELSIVINLMFIFSDDYIYYSFHQWTKKMKSYQKSLYFSKDYSSFLNNGIQISYERNCSRNFKLFKEELEKSVVQTQDVKCKVILAIFELLTKQRDNTLYKGKVIDMLDLLELVSWKNYVLEDLSQKKY